MDRHDRPSERCGDVSQRLELVLDRLALIGGQALMDRHGGAGQVIVPVIPVTVDRQGVNANRWFRVRPA